MRIIDTRDSANARALAALLDRRPGRDPLVQRRVAAIVARVRRDGDRALVMYAKRFDGLSAPMEVARADMERAARGLASDVTSAISFAARRIRRVAAKQKPRSWTIVPTPGVAIRQRVLPLDRVGCYVPGGRYPLPSSLLMTAIPAVVAGVPEIVAVCPKPDPTVMYAALEAGVTRLFRIGGAHAIAALAYGTASVPRVDRIVGPGNAYVAAAKAHVAADCAIDFFAGPSEIAVISNAGNPAWIAADLIAQAEHDPEARAILITSSKRLASSVAREIARQTPAEGPARRALAAAGGIVVTRSLDEAIGLAQRLAPEHAVCDTQAVADRLTRAGTVFVGDFSAQASGDYVTGSNHVLPTAGAAAARGGLSTADFVRLSTVQHLTAQGLRAIAPAGIALANAEGLVSHAQSLRVRLKTERRRTRGARS
ncbi:MAG TPA: histidinol dehydrogenase [Vicinamibacterales bacterium]|nr:histidinol dehydrogenase [Vicinamibacterales bacterium]